jgi:hypothetical protein
LIVAVVVVTLSADVAAAVVVQGPAVRSHRTENCSDFSVVGKVMDWVPYPAVVGIKCEVVDLAESRLGH